MGREAGLGVVIGVAEGDFLGSVGLFGDDDASEGMRKDEFGKTPDKIGVLTNLLGETIGAANQDNDVSVVQEGGLEFARIFI